MKKAVVIFSGGLDSTVCLGLAADKFDNVIALTFDYGQRHKKEIESAKKIAACYKNAEHIIVKIDITQWGGSALTDQKIEVPSYGVTESIPLTYVPARNIIFLSVALSVAEAKDAGEIYFGANVLDYSGYPDCRPEFIRAFEKVAEVGQKRGIEGNPVKIITPLINMSKADIAKLAVKIKAPIEFTWSCYKGGNVPCGVCDSCMLRAKGFAEARIEDPALTEA